MSRLLSYVPLLCLLGDRIDTDFREVLPMPLRLGVVLAASQLEDLDLRAATVSEDSGRHFRAGHQGITELHGVAVRNHQHLVEDDLSANVCRYLFYFDLFAGGNAILLAAGFYDRVHCGLQPNEFEDRWATLEGVPTELAIIREFPRKVKDLSGALPPRREARHRPAE